MVWHCRRSGIRGSRYEGRVEGLKEGLLSALETRFGIVPEGLGVQLKKIRDESRLRHALRLAITSNGFPVGNKHRTTADFADLRGSIRVATKR
jgi:hypothetical protein